jgi:hypothetical protein
MTYHVELHNPARCFRDENGELVCECVPVVVRESDTERALAGYTSKVGVSDESDTIRAAPSLLLTPGTAGSLRGTTPGVRR